jgi:hypothetical protein
MSDRDAITRCMQNPAAEGRVGCMLYERDGRTDTHCDDLSGEAGFRCSRNFSISVLVQIRQPVQYPGLHGHTTYKVQSVREPRGPVLFISTGTLSYPTFNISSYPDTEFYFSVPPTSPRVNQDIHTAPLHAPLTPGRRIDRISVENLECDHQVRCCRVASSRNRPAFPVPRLD